MFFVRGRDAGAWAEIAVVVGDLVRLFDERYGAPL
jgi:hypothetical protein